MLNNEVTRLITKHFQSKPYYPKLLEAVTHTSQRLIIGQIQDLILAKQNVLEHTVASHERLSMNKAAFVPIMTTRFSMALAGLDDPEMHRQTQPILEEIGKFIQCQNDMTDVYDDKIVAGRAGTDIRNGRCTFLTTMTNKLGSPAQRKFLAENYGQNDPEKIARVIDLFNELKMQEVFEKRKIQFKETINTIVETSPHCLPKPGVQALLGVIVGRTML